MVGNATKHNKQAPVHSRMQGFTIIELLVVVAILTIIATISMSAFGPLITNRKLDHIADALKHTITLAQNLSQQNGEYTLLCGGTNDSTCQGSWQKGWSLYQIDHEGSGLKKAYSFENPYTLILINPEVQEIKFNSQKQLFGMTAVSISICSKDKDKGYKLDVDASGTSAKFYYENTGELKC